MIGKQQQQFMILSICAFGVMMTSAASKAAKEAHDNLRGVCLAADYLNVNREELNFEAQTCGIDAAMEHQIERESDPDYDEHGMFQQLMWPAAILGLLFCGLGLMVLCGRMEQNFREKVDKKIINTQQPLSPIAARLPNVNVIVSGISGDSLIANNA